MSTPNPTATPPPHPQPAKRLPSSHPTAQSNQHSTPPAPARKLPPPLHISPASTIADTSSLTGTHPITIAARTIINPRAKIISTHGAVSIGEGSVVCERASVGLLSAATGSVEGNTRRGGGEEKGEEEHGVRLGKGVVIESGAMVEAREVGEGTVVEVGARVGRGCVVGKHCKIAPLTHIAAYEIIPDHTVVYGAGNALRRRIDKSGFAEARMKVGERHVEVLRGLVPSAGMRGQ